MRQTNTILAVALVLACAVSASADVRIFITKANGTFGEWGQDIFADALIPATPDGCTYCCNGQPGPHTINQLAQFDFGHATGGGTFPPSNLDTSSPITINLAQGEIGYIWLQFNRRSDGTYAACAGDKLNGLKVMGTGVDLTAVWYPQSDTCFGASKRWDGPISPPDFPGWISHRDEAEVLVGVNAAGLVNMSADASWNLYVGRNGGDSNPANQGRICLLGAIQFDTPGTFTLVFPDQDYNLDYSFGNGVHDTWSLPTVNVVSWPLGDMNCDGVTNFADINPFVIALSNPTAYQAAYPNCNILNGDCNHDGAVNFADINPFVARLTGGG